MLPVKIQDNRVHVGLRFSVSFQRTERVNQERLVRRPVSRGQLPVRLTEKLPQLGTDCGEGACVVVPCDKDEAAWLGFSGENARRVALKIRQGDVNAVTGGAWDEALHQPQDYLVPPDQPSWYGVRTGGGQVRQFTNDPLDLVVYEPKQPIPPTPFPPTNWDRAFYSADDNSQALSEATSFRLVPDPPGITFWSSTPSSHVTVYFVDSESWRALTGEEPPELASEYEGNLLP